MFQCGINKLDFIVIVQLDSQSLLTLQLAKMFAANLIQSSIKLLNNVNVPKLIILKQEL